MFATLNMSWLGDKAIFLQKGKTGLQRVDFFFPPSNFLFVLGSDVGKTRLSFLNLRLEKCTCSWLVEKREKRGSKRLRANLPQASSE